MPKAALSVHDQRGQSTPEYVAVILAVTAVLLVVAALDVGAVARGMSGAVRSAICSILPGDCPADGTEVAAPDDAFVPTEPCLTASSSRSIGGKITLFSIGAEGEIEGRREVRSDRTVAVTLRGTGAIGGKIAGGAKARLDTGDVVTGAGAFAEARLMGEGSGARTYVFPDQDAANEFISDVKSWAVENVTSFAIRNSPPGIGRVGDFFYRRLIADNIDMDFPDAEESYFTGGIRLEGKAGSRVPSRMPTSKALWRRVSEENSITARAT